MKTLDEQHAADDELRRIRQKLVELDATVESVRAAPLPFEDVEARVRAAFEAKRASGYSGLEVLEALRWPPRSATEGGQPWIARLQVTPELIFSLLGDELLERAVEHLRNADSAKPGLSMEAREKKLRKLAADRVQLEEHEEREILRLEADGWYVTRRRDIDAELVNRIWDEHFATESTA